MRSHHPPERTGATVTTGAAVDAHPDSNRIVVFVDNDAPRGTDAGKAGSVATAAAP
jgi:hypothetical protein